MPLLDHFHTPLYPFFHWESFHSHWASILTNPLNVALLPEDYVAAPHVKMGSEVEIQVGSFELFREKHNAGGTATAAYAPPVPALSVPGAWPALDLFEILVRPEGSGRLAAAIEFVSPANEDRPANRRAFAVKCTSYLQDGAGLVVADIVTNRTGYLSQDLLDLVAGPGAVPLPPMETLYALACRTVAAGDKHGRLEGWPTKLELGQCLPTMPLWLAPDTVIGVPLEESYTETY